MEQKYKVVLLSSEVGGGFYGRIYNVAGKDKGSALLEALCTHAGAGHDLNVVKKTRVFPEAQEVPGQTNRTLLGLARIP